MPEGVRMLKALVRVFFGGEENTTTDLLEARVYQGDVATNHGELASKLGLDTDNLKTVDYYNALMGVQFNKNVRNMPHDERIKTIAQAVAALDDLEQSRRTGNWS